MKMTKLECVTREDYLAAVSARVSAAHTTRSTGSRRGGYGVVAKAYGINTNQLHAALTGTSNPHGKMLEHDGLEPVTVYVRKAVRHG